MPPSGWYDDPETPWTWRYWDGAAWTEHRAPMWVPPARDPQSFSVWFERSVAIGKLAFRRAGALLVAVWLLLGAVGLGLIFSAFDSDRGRELRRLLIIDDSPLTPSGTVLNADLTDAEADRAWELARDTFWSASPWLAALAVAVLVSAAWSVAIVARVVRPRLVETDGADRTVEPLGSVVAGSLRRVPAVLGSGIVVFGVFAMVLAVCFVPIVLVIAADGGGAAIVLTVLFVVVLVSVVSVWLWGRLALASVLAALGGHGLGIGRSWSITADRFWFVVGRVVVTGLIAGAAGGVANVVNGFGQFFGVAVYLVLVVVLQSVAVAVSMIITTCGHVVIIDQLDDPAIGSLRDDAHA
jgi:hypothetical protein